MAYTATLTKALYNYGTYLMATFFNFFKQCIFSKPGKYRGSRSEKFVTWCLQTHGKSKRTLLANKSTKVPFIKKKL